jgi:thiol-disulfide isomerase/thioredoxin
MTERILNDRLTRARISAFGLFFLLLIAAAGESVFAQTKRAKPAAKKAALAKTAQTPPAKLPQVRAVNETELKAVFKQSAAAGRPLLVNFWATWCDPCREEFPDLVKIDADYRARGLDVIAVSLDELADIKTAVPKFLAGVKAEMPSYLLTVNDEAAFFESITSATGKPEDAIVGLPITVVFDRNGKIAYKRLGKFKTETLRAEVEKTLAPEARGQTVALLDFVKIKDGKRAEAVYYYENNWKLYREAALKKGFIISYEIVEIEAAANSQFDLILITRYADKRQYEESEKNFEPILKELRPNGPALLNDLKPADFRVNVFASAATPLFVSGK